MERISRMDPQVNHASIQQARRGKVGVLTLHDGANWGSIWQARELAGWLGALMVNLRDPQRAAATRASSTRDERQAFHRYVTGSLPLSGPAVTSASEDEWLDHINSLGLDLLVVGGDEPWKFAHPPPAKPGLRMAVPNGYWPDERVNCTRVAFAVCEGLSDFGALPVSIRRELSRRLETFELLCLRDRRTAEAIGTLSPECADRIRLTPDPAWASPEPRPEDITACQARIEPLRSSGKILVLTYGAVPEKTKRRLQAEPSVRLIPFHRIAIHNPGQFEALIAMSDLLVTSRMHGLIAALRNGVPVVITKPRPKVVEILRDSGLQNVTLDLGRTPAGALAAAIRDWPRQEAQAWAASCRQRFVVVMEAVFGLLRPTGPP